MYLVSNHNTNIILECGFDYDSILTMLNENNITFKDINACFTSHFHIDHSMSIKTLDELGIPCYCTYETKNRYNISHNNSIELQDNKIYKINSIQILSFIVDHGQCECYGFILKDKDSLILFATDFKKCDKNLKKFAFNEVFIECNYVEELLVYNKEHVEDEFNKKYYRQINTHMELENLIIHLKEMNLEQCDKITLIHISQDVGDSKFMKRKIEREFGIECVALLPNGEEY